MAAGKFTDNTPKVKAAVAEELKNALEQIGVQAEGDITNSITAKGLVRSGGLRQSITHIVKDFSVHVGSALEHAVFHEVGTGVHAENGSGRKGWWVYVEGSDSKGRTTHKTYSFEEAKKIMAILRSQGLDAHMTQGVKASHFLKEAVEGGMGQYNRILENHVGEALSKFRG